MIEQLTMGGYNIKPTVQKFVDQLSKNGNNIKAARRFAIKFLLSTTADQIRPIEGLLEEIAATSKKVKKVQQ